MLRKKTSMELEKALKQWSAKKAQLVATLILVKELHGKARDAIKCQGAVSEKKRLINPSGSVTKTEKSI